MKYIIMYNQEHTQEVGLQVPTPVILKIFSNFLMLVNRALSRTTVGGAP